ncbi:hypothetical protein [Anaerosporobacter sp.]|uniref:hypothetical protein n=1 Tax=Anaerosporobacter sp. TaxID=1872529 RepID=UPI00286F3B98|nr:hypothetical protein [Anaerosporobacter sp.]
MNKNKGTLFISKLIEKIQLCIGAILVFVCGFGLISCIVDQEVDTSTLVTAIVFIGLGIWLIKLSRARKKLVFNFRAYVAYLSTDPTGSIEELANSMGTSSDVITSNLKQMIQKKFFVNAYIDSVNKRIVFPNMHVSNTQNSAQFATYNQAKDVEYMTVTCKNCGGINKIAVGKVEECEYCGSPIKQD